MRPFLTATHNTNHAENMKKITFALQFFMFISDSLGGVYNDYLTFSRQPRHGRYSAFVDLAPDLSRPTLIDLTLLFFDTG